MQFVPVAEQDHSNGAGIQEADHAARLTIGSRTTTEPRADGVDGRAAPVGSGRAHGEGYAAAHATNLALEWGTKRLAVRLI